MFGMNPTTYKTLTLDSGLRIVTICHEQANVEYFGIVVGAGSAMETNEQHGLAHFVEHTLFKGTVKHSANYILNRIETIGGELNAFTNKEETAIFTITPSGHLKRCMSLIAEIVTDSVFPEMEIAKERTVIEEEIDSYLDTPSEAIFDEMDEILFLGSSYAHNILGSKKSIKNFTSKDCREWIKTWFTPSNSVIFYSGPLEIGNVAEIAEKEFSHYKGEAQGECQLNIPAIMPSKKVIDLGHCHQCHATVAWRIPGYNDTLKYPLLLLNNMLAGPAMNSILNLQLREKRGFVYTIDANPSLYRNGGALIIYFGCDKKDESKCLQIINREINKLLTNGVTTRHLNQSKKQYLGQTAIALENRENAIMNAARALLSRNKIVEFSGFCEKINSITPDVLNEALRLLNPQLESCLTIR